MMPTTRLRPSSIGRVYTFRFLFSKRIIFTMQQNKERWMELCEQMAVEQDPEKVLALAEEINRLLEAKERRLGLLPPKPPA